jgi:pimeloyl-ACP methyl ester carboxylesterase
MTKNAGKSLRQRIRRVWAILGVTALFGFTGWSLVAYAASSEARRAMNSSDEVRVDRGDFLWEFGPHAPPAEAGVGLLFFPGALVDPAAYAPLLRAVAEAGHPVDLLPLPRRGAFGGADDPRLFTSAREVIRNHPGAAGWVIAGHSRGAVAASTLAADPDLPVAGLILIGTSHPRDVDLSQLTAPVTKIVATRDGLAQPDEVRANAPLLPAHTRWIWIEGGNHSHFGWYGFQPGDRRAIIPADRQRTMMIEAVLETMHTVNAERMREAQSAGI